MGWQRGWWLGEEHVTFALPLVDVMHACHRVSGTWPGDLWQLEQTVRS